MTHWLADATQRAGWLPHTPGRNLQTE